MPENERRLIQQCCKGDRLSQKKLYALFAPKMYVICLRYAKNREDAEEILQEGFLKVFGHLQQFTFSGSFEGWIRKIMVNVALQKYRAKSLLYPVTDIENMNGIRVEEEGIYSRLDMKDMVALVQTLPPAYRLVFNLYVFEKMKHKEIANLLGIAEGTSKSNLADAKAILRKAMIKQTQIENTKQNYA